MRATFLALAVLAGLTMATSQAGVIGYVNNASTNSTDWTTAVTGLGGSVNSDVNFNAMSLGTLVSTFYLGSDGVTLTGTTGSADQVENGAGPGQGNTAGAIPGEGPHAASNFLLMSSPGNTGSDSLIVSFATPVLGAGLFTIDRFFGTGNINDISIEAYTGANATGTLLGSFSGLSANFQANNLYFMGITSSAGDIGSIRLVRGNDNSGDNIGLDNIMFATGTGGTVPEPASMTLLAAGLAAVGTFRRIRKA